MAPTTRAQGVEAFRHVMVKVLGLDEESQLWKALTLDGYNSISDIATMTDLEIDGLSYEEDVSANEVRKRVVVKKQRKLLLHLLLWRDWKNKQLKSFGNEQWLLEIVEKYVEKYESRKMF